MLFAVASVACQGGGASEATVQSLRQPLESSSVPAYVSSDNHGGHLFARQLQLLAPAAPAAPPPRMARK
ncbi:MAG TPA: hypothetical protein VMT87_04025 [Vicinamibacteria bacterium]|nr:hypothetical protein [Vicinamibacteria bacterium]